MPKGRGKEQRLVRPVNQKEAAGQEDRQRADQVAGVFALCSRRFDLSANPNSLSHRVSDALDYLGETAAGATLDEDGGNDNVQVTRSHPLIQVVEGIFDTRADLY